MKWEGEEVMTVTRVPAELVFGVSSRRPFVGEIPTARYPHGYMGDNRYRWVG